MKLLLGLCGTGATVASPQHILYLREAGIDVRVVLSMNALKFVSHDVVESFSRHKAFTSVFDRGEGLAVPHVELAEWCDAFLVMPASANVISLLASGSASDLISTCALHCSSPVVVVPALNATLLAHPAVRRNLRTLRRDGIHVLGPETGTSIQVASGVRVGLAMPSLDDVVKHLRRLTRPRKGNTP
jgi:phosphopantothenoylcysteine decarboxylase/phosphopantothenate--cysteine ligase